MPDVNQNAPDTTDTPSEQAVGQSNFNSNHSNDGDLDDIDALIPDELRQAFEANEAATAPNIAGPSITEVMDAASKKVDDSENDQDINANASEDEEEVTNNIADTEDDLVLNDENITKLLEGDLDAVAKNAQQLSDEDADAPGWHNNKSYTDLLEKVNYTGVTQEQLDAIITEASDTKVLQNGKYTTGLKDKVTELENAKEVSILELDRLREIERLAHFETSEDVTSKYAKPMDTAANEVAKILEFEGIPLQAQQIMGVTDRASLNNMLADYTMDDDARMKLTNQWKSYREMAVSYTADRTEAKKDLSKYLGTNLDSKVANKILQNSLSEFMQSDEKYAYIKDGILGGIDKNPEVSNVLANGKNNFLNILQALGAPSDYVHNDKWLDGLAKYMLDAAHNKSKTDQYYKAMEKHQQTEKNFIKVVKAYRKLAGSAKGFNGNNGSIVPTSNKGGKAQQTQDLEEFKSFLGGDIDMMDMLG